MTTFRLPSVVALALFATVLAVRPARAAEVTVRGWGFEVAKLEDAEVNFIMELSMMQRRAQARIDNKVANPVFDEERTRHFLDSLYAMAQADGVSTSAELLEIETIAAEFGLTAKGTREPGKGD